MTIIINHAIRISEEDPNGKFKACVQRQNHKKYGQMTIANLRKLAVLTQQWSQCHFVSVITSVDKGDFGLYKCRFENSMGSVHNNVYLKRKCEFNQIINCQLYFSLELKTAAPAQPRTEPTSESAMIQSSTSIVLISNISLLVFLLQWYPATTLTSTTRHKTINTSRHTQCVYFIGQWMNYVSSFQFHWLYFSPRQAPSRFLSQPPPVSSSYSWATHTLPRAPGFWPPCPFR